MDLLLEPTSGSGLKWPARPLDGDHDGILTHLDESTPVRLMATLTELTVACSDEPVANAVTTADNGRFDYLPVRSGLSGPIVGLFRRSEAGEDLAAPVARVMQRLSGTNLIGAEAPLLDFVYTADQSPCRLVLDRSEIRGLVTLSDIQRLPVRTALFSLFIHLELLVTRRLRMKLGNSADILERIPEPRRTKVKRDWNKAISARMDRDPFSVMMFTDKKLVACQLEEFADVGEQMNADFTLINCELRNPIAHGNEFALTVESALDVVRAAQLLRHWIKRLR